MHIGKNESNFFKYTFYRGKLYKISIFITQDQDVYKKFFGWILHPNQDENFHLQTDIPS